MFIGYMPLGVRQGLYEGKMTITSTVCSQDVLLPALKAEHGLLVTAGDWESGFLGSVTPWLGGHGPLFPHWEDGDIVKLIECMRSCLGSWAAR